MYAMGGIDLMEGTLGDVWILDIGKLNRLLDNENLQGEEIWQLYPTTGDAPGKVSYHKAISIENSIYIYGGVINNENPDQSLFCLDTRTGIWTKCVSHVFP
jgi:hypothetical protein